jgi:hypothetical protein
VDNGNISVEFTDTNIVSGQWYNANFRYRASDDAMFLQLDSVDQSTKVTVPTGTFTQIRNNGTINIGYNNGSGAYYGGFFIDNLRIKNTLTLPMVSPEREYLFNNDLSDTGSEQQDGSATDAIYNVDTP